MLAQTSPVIDTTAVIPMTGWLAFGHLRTRTADSVWIVAGRSELKGGIKPSASDKLTPTAAAVISIDTLKYISVPLRTGLSLTESSFTIEALPYRDARRQQMANRQRRTLTDEQRARLAERRKNMAGKPPPATVPKQKVNSFANGKHGAVSLSNKCAGSAACSRSRCGWSRRR